MNVPTPPPRGESALALQEALGGRYVLKRKLGQGGMGVVFLAWETALNRMVALKVLPAAGAVPELRERFLHEARIAARLSHPNIVPIYAVDEAGPWLFYTMAYVHGENLYQRILTRGRLSAGETARILRDVALAVDYAHRQGVLHRDLKPQNILLEEPGDRVLVTDFGIARLLAEAPPAGSGQTLGTAAYLSPERAAGLPADERSDIYSLGIMGYFMATGEEPFKGRVTEILQHQVCTPPPPLRVLGLHLDPTLSEVVGRCLAKDPLARFQAACELAAALSLAPELASTLPLTLRKFLRRVKLATQSRYLSVLLGLSSLSVLGQAVDDGNWDRAAAAAGFLSLLLALPVVAVFHATRRLLEAGFGHTRIIHAMRMDRDRQEQEIGIPGRKRSRGATVALRVAQSGGGLFLLGVLSVLIGPKLPEKVFILCMSGGGITAVIAGLVYMGLDWERHHLVGQRWRRFLESRWGGWWVKLAGLGLPRLPGDPLRTALAPAPVAELPRPAAGDLPSLPAVVQRSQGCLQQGEAYLLGTSADRLFLGRGATPEEQEFERGLQENLEQIQAVLAELTGPDPSAALIAAAQAVCDAVDALIGGREWSL